MVIEQSTARTRAVAIEHERRRESDRDTGQQSRRGKYLKETKTDKATGSKSGRQRQEPMPRWSECTREHNACARWMKGGAGAQARERGRARAGKTSDRERVRERERGRAQEHRRQSTSSKESACGLHN